MTASETKVLKTLLVATMRPIAVMLLKFGIGYREFADACKIAFVEVASEGFGNRGRPTNISRVALMTGLTRKEVRRIKDDQSRGNRPNAVITHFPAEVLRLWYTNERYCESTGIPKPLPWDKEPGSFTELVRNCGSNLSPVAMRAELIRVGAVQQDEFGVLTAFRRYFISDSARDRLTEGIHFGIRPMALTVAKNVTTEQVGALRFQRVVDSYSIPTDRRSALEQQVTERLRQFSEEIDDLLSEAGETGDKDKEWSAVGVGLFYFEDDESPPRL